MSTKNLCFVDYKEPNSLDFHNSKFDINLLVLELKIYLKFLALIIRIEFGLKYLNQSDFKYKGSRKMNNDKPYDIIKEYLVKLSLLE